MRHRTRIRRARSVQDFLWFLVLQFGLERQAGRGNEWRQVCWCKEPFFRPPNACSWKQREVPLCDEANRGGSPFFVLSWHCVSSCGGQTTLWHRGAPSGVSMCTGVILEIKQQPNTRAMKTCMTIHNTEISTILDEMRLVLRHHGFQEWHKSTKAFSVSFCVRPFRWLFRPSPHALHCLMQD